MYENSVPVGKLKPYLVYTGVRVIDEPITSILPAMIMLFSSYTTPKRTLRLLLSK